MPEKVEEALLTNDIAKKLPKFTKTTSDCLYLGRGYNFPVALEGL